MFPRKSCAFVHSFGRKRLTGGKLTEISVFLLRVQSIIIKCNFSNAICARHRVCRRALSLRGRLRKGKNHDAFSRRPSRSSRSRYVSESFIHLGTDWHTPTDDQKVAWEIKTARQPVSLASVDFTEYSRASASRVLVVQYVSVSASLMQIPRGIRNRFFPWQTIRQNVTCSDIRTIRRSEYFGGIILQIKDEEIKEKKVTVIMLDFVSINILHNAWTLLL